MKLTLVVIFGYVASTFVDCLDRLVAEQTYAEGAKCIDNYIASLPDLANHQTPADVKYKYPVDAIYHYNEIRNWTDYFVKNIPMGGTSFYKGPWIENAWITKFSKFPLDSFNGLIPIFMPWNDARNYYYYDSVGNKDPIAKSYLDGLMKLLRKDVIYITVNQPNEGLFESMKSVPDNIIVLSSGGVGHIAIPLVAKTLPLSNITVDQILSADSRSYEVSFFGTIDHGRFRTNFISELKLRLKRHKASWRSYFGSSKTWEIGMGKTQYNLAPAGIGRTSFRVAEIVQLGRIPIYIYDDLPWLPYPNTDISLEKIGFVVDNAGDLMELITTITPTELRNKMNAVLLARDAYTLTGIMREIELFLQEPFSTTGGSHLRCIGRRNKWMDKYKHIKKHIVSAIYTSTNS